MSLYLGNTPIANTGYDKADTDLGNLTSTGKNIANWSNNVTNCITEIPQDIKLELNNGTLTLKAGSKVYVPNGSGVFDTVTTSADKSWGQTTYADGKLMVFYRNQYNDLFSLNDSDCYSGSTAPTAHTNMVWYDTANNKIKWTSNGGSTWNDEGLSLPITNSSYANGTGFTAIDQVFNGFGYIGSTVFALPGVKGLIPNGRNSDGSLKNIEIITDHVVTVTNASGLTIDLWYTIDAGGNLANSLADYWKYDEQKNVFVHDGVLFSAFIPIAHSYANSGKVENFVSKTAFHALDYNDSSTISGWSMPSGRYIDLTLGASGATYTAPANGWFFARATSSLGYVAFYSQSGIRGQLCSYVTNVVDGYGCYQVHKGEKVLIYYSNSLRDLKFIYAQGSESEA